MVKAPTIKFLCSYGGRIVPRHTDGLLRYSGGLTRYLAVHRSISFSELMEKLVEFCGSSVVLRCQLPKGDLETLVTIKSDEDLANIIEEYDRASKSAPRPLAIRAVLTPSPSVKKPSPSSSLDSDYSPHAASVSTSSGGFRSPPKSFMKVSPSSSACGHGGSCYRPLVGYPIGVRSEAAKLRYYPFGAAALDGKSRLPHHRAPRCH